MTQRPLGAGNEEDDPARSMIVQRTERADGRYLIYYDWPEALAGDVTDGDDPAAADPDV